MRPRAGFTLAELMVVLPLGMLLAALVIAALVAQSRLARGLAELASRAEAERVTANLLPAELRWAAPGDLRSDGTDSVRTRVFRGFGVPCNAPGGAWRWYGVRAPAEHKDSVLVLSGGGERVFAVAGTQSVAACAGYRIQGAPPGQAVLVFETGTYYLRDGALRFRSGGEGRQPLTDQWFQDGATALERSAHGSWTAARLVLRPLRGARETETRHISWTLANHLPAP